MTPLQKSPFPFYPPLLTQCPLPTGLVFFCPRPIFSVTSDGTFPAGGTSRPFCPFLPRINSPPHFPRVVIFFSQTTLSSPYSWPLFLANKTFFALARIQMTIAGAFWPPPFPPLAPDRFTSPSELLTVPFPPQPPIQITKNQRSSFVCFASECFRIYSPVLLLPPTEVRPPPLSTPSPFLTSLEFLLTSISPLGF